MSIVDAIKKLREQLTGEPGKGASITDAINDLTEGLTGEPGVGASISDAISNLADHADDIPGGGGSNIKKIADGDFTVDNAPVEIQYEPGIEQVYPYAWTSVTVDGIELNYESATKRFTKIQDGKKYWVQAFGGFTNYVLRVTNQRNGSQYMNGTYHVVIMGGDGMDITSNGIVDVDGKLKANVDVKPTFTTWDVAISCDESLAGKVPFSFVIVQDNGTVSNIGGLDSVVPSSPYTAKELAGQMCICWTEDGTAIDITATNASDINKSSSLNHDCVSAFIKANTTLTVVPYTS